MSCEKMQFASRILCVISPIFHRNTLILLGFKGLIDESTTDYKYKKLKLFNPIVGLSKTIKITNCGIKKPLTLNKFDYVEWKVW